MVTKFASLATASALLLTVAPAAVADTISAPVQFSFETFDESPQMIIASQFPEMWYDHEHGMFAEFEADHQQMYIENPYFQGVWYGRHAGEPLGEGASVWTITIEDHPNYGPMQIVLGLFLTAYDSGGSYTRWEGEFAGAYGPPMGFGETVSIAGVWSAQVVPAPGVASLLALTGLARRRRRD